MQTIVKMIFGSHLYGTSTASSDTDIKGVFLPTREQVLLQRVPNSLNESRDKKYKERNTSADTDVEMYSLHYFLKLALAGETVALDMLHAPSTAWHEASPVWKDLVSHRERFYTKNLKSFVGYARRQAAKYGVKGSRLATAKQVLEHLQSKYTQYRKSNGECEARLADIWESLPTGQHISFLEIKQDRLYNVCGKNLLSTARINHYIPMLQNFVNMYGNRARQAELNEGIDWKAVSHAFRAAYQVRHILTVGGYTYPLPETEYIRAVKSGTLSFLNDVGPALELLMDELEELSQQSSLPEQPDQAFWDRWLMSVLYTRLGDL